MMVRIIIIITSTPPIATRMGNATGLDGRQGAPPLGCVGGALSLCCEGHAVVLCCVEVVFEVGDAVVEVDIGEPAGGSGVVWETSIVPVEGRVLGPVSAVGGIVGGAIDVIGF